MNPTRPDTPAAVTTVTVFAWWRSRLRKRSAATTAGPLITVMASSVPAPYAAQCGGHLSRKAAMRGAPRFMGQLPRPGAAG